MKKLVIFGNGKMADVLFYSFNRESDYEVVAFTCDTEFIKEEVFNGLPVIPFEQVAAKYAPADHCMFIATGYQGLNDLRTEKYLAAKDMGYEIVSYIHPGAAVPANVTVGENCAIMNHACVQPCVELGNNVFVWHGAIVGHHSRVGDNCWITSGANIAGNVTLGRNCFLAINCTVGHSVSVGEYCFLGSNTLTTKNLGDNKVVIEQSTKAFRLDSRQFLEMSAFKSL